MKCVWDGNSFGQFRLDVVLPLEELLHDLGRVVVEEEAALLVELGDALHLPGGQLEVEDVPILRHPLLVGGLGDENHAALQEEPQRHLRHALAVLLAYLRQHGVGEEAVLALGEGTPRHDVAAVLLHIPLRLHLLVEDVGLHLVDGGLDLDVRLQVDEAVGEEVAHADGAHLALALGALHGAVRAVVVAEGLVDEQQVDVAGLQLAQALQDAGVGFLLARVAYPHLGHDEQLLARHATLPQGLAHALLVVVRLGGVYQPVACLDGVEHAPLTLRRVYLIHAVAQLRHLHAIV